MFKKVLSLILLTVLVLTSFVIPAYADSAIGEIGTEEMQPIDQEERIPLKDSYTEEEIQAILSGDHNFDIPEEGIKFSSENFPFAVDENVVSPDAVYVEEDDYYITVLSSGKILIAPKLTYITTTNYVESEAYMWVFEEVDTFTYTIRNKLNPDTCLAASPSTSGNSAVIKKTYSATDVTCHWSMSITSNGNYIQSEATGTNAYGQYLYLSGNQFVMSSSNSTYIGIVDVDWFVPCTSISVGDYLSIPFGITTNFGIKETVPSNANLLGDKYVTYTIGSTNMCHINVERKELLGRTMTLAAGIDTTITVTHKMTGATSTTPIYIGYNTNIKVFYDNAFKSICITEGSLNNSPSAQIEEWFDAVRKKYAQDLNIHLELISTTTFTSYPETLDSNGNMICSAAGTPNTKCNCAPEGEEEVCENSSMGDLKTYHHKNFDNIFFRLTAPDKTKYLYLYFTGHRTCDPDNSNPALTCSGSPVGSSLKAYGYALVAVNANNSNGLEDGKIKKTIAHEILHLFYVSHHYNDGILNENDNCIMGDNRNDSGVYDKLTICSDCTNTALANANMHNHR